MFDCREANDQFLINNSKVPNFFYEKEGKRRIINSKKKIKNLLNENGYNHISIKRISRIKSKLPKDYYDLLAMECSDYEYSDFDADAVDDYHETYSWGDDCEQEIRTRYYEDKYGNRWADYGDEREMHEEGEYAREMYDEEERERENREYEIDW